jgi:hypothetical protein
LVVASPKKFGHGFFEISLHLSIGFFQRRAHANRDRLLIVIRQVGRHILKA